MIPWRLVPLLVLTSLLTTYLSAQNCSFSVDAGQDLQLCEPGGTVTLNGSITGMFSFFEWTPATGLSDPASLNPQASVSATTVYTLTAFEPGSTNLITNGDFEAGNTGFTSDYSFVPLGQDLINGGTYTVATSPDLVSTILPPCVDHTTGMGQMMIVNGDGNVGANVWCQTVSILPDSYYDFSFWLATAQPIGPGELSVSINGQAVGSSVNAPSTFCSWVPHAVQWYSGTANSADFCIVNQSSNGGLLGNDFLLDDIALIPYCEESDEVVVEIIPNSSLSIDTVLCEGECIFIGNTPYCSDFVGSQTISSVNGCDSTVNLNLEVLQPVAGVFPFPELNCITSSIDLVAVPSLLDPLALVSYEWTGPNGFLANQSMVTVFEPGEYTLLVTHELNGVSCFATTTITVFQDITLPMVDAGPDLLLDCLQPVDTLDGSNSSSGAEFLVNWTGPAGFSSTELIPEVVLPGSYNLTIFNTNNGCLSSDMVQVVSIVDTPHIFVGDSQLTCDSSEVSLIGGSNDPNISYAWSGPNGFASELQNPSVSDTGYYILLVTDTLNACTSSDTAFVGGSALAELVDLLPDTITCQDTAVLLEAIPLAVWDTLWWNGPNGLFSNDSSLWVVESGTYILFAGLNNGCLDSAVVSVPADTFPPQFTLSGGTIDCNQPQAQLSASSSDSMLSYFWQGPGFFEDTTASPVVSEEGWYILTVTNKAGCQSTDSVEVVSNIILTPIVLYDTLPDCDSSYSDTLIILSLGGCDSLLEITDHQFIPPDSTFLFESSCNPVDTGLQMAVLSNILGCDSLVFTYTALVDADTTFLQEFTCNPADVDTLIQLFQGASGCDSVLITQTSLLPGDSLFLTAASCNPQDTGVQVTVLSNQFGCDSVLITQTSLLPSDSLFFTAASCNPQDTGIQVTVLSNQFGCDSVLITQTSLLPSDSLFFTAASCNPQDTGIQVTVLSNQFGCDSVLITQTSLLPSDSLFFTAASCNPQDTGVQVTVLSNQFGCDSVLITQTSLLPSDSLFFAAASCNPQDTGVQVTVLSNQFGCDSVLITQTSLLPGDSLFFTAASCNPQDTGIQATVLSNQFGCDSVLITQTSLLPGDSLFFTTASCNPQDTGVQVTVLSNQFGCDSVLITQTSLLPGDSLFFTAASCNPQDTGVQVTVLSNQFGCDSVLITQTSLLPGDSLFFTAASCNPQDTGIQVTVLSNQFGCDSVLITQTSLLPSDSLFFTTASCNPQDTGIQVTVLSNQFGCDSVLITQTSLLPSDSLFFTTASCNPQDTGVQVTVLSNQFGCDSVLITQTSLLPGDSLFFTAASCNPQDTGIQVTVLSNQFGCDSVLITEVGWLEPGISDLNFTLCPGDTLDIAGMLVYSDSLLIDTLAGAAQNGCDSLLFIKAELLPYPEVLKKERICLGDSINFGGQTLSSAGIYLDTLKIPGSCDTIFSLELEVIDLSDLDLGLPESQVIEAGEFLRLNPFIPFSPAAIQWSPEKFIPCDTCLAPLVYPKENTLFWVTIQDSTGCKVEGSTWVYVLSSRDIYIPNVFSPNGDGYNDLFYVHSSDPNVLIRSFQVFDRWGQSVFRVDNAVANDTRFAWDGTFRNKPLEPAVFVYLLEIEWKDGEKEWLGGEITLFR